LNSLQQARNPKTFLRARRLADIWARSRHRPCRLCTGGLFFFGPALMDGSKQSQLYMLPNLLRPKQTICLLSPRSKQLCGSAPPHSPCHTQRRFTRSSSSARRHGIGIVLLHGVQRRRQRRRRRRRAGPQGVLPRHDDRRGALHALPRTAAPPELVRRVPLLLTADGRCRRRRRSVRRTDR